jgi:hypothetical protein
MLTSISDYPDYTELCQRAAEDDALFQTFREHPTYKAVVSASLNLEGRDYLAMLEQRGFDMAFFEQLREHDRIGGPHLVSYPGIGAAAPQTVRYVKVLQDLELMFGSLEGASIAEIGCGFGGQCAVIAKRYKVARYTLLDLPAPLALSRRYLDTLGIENAVCTPLEKLPFSSRFDLAISCYGLSEIARPFQAMYIQRILMRSKAGYLVWNNEGMKQHTDWQKEFLGSEMIYGEELMSMLPGSRLAEPSWVSEDDRLNNAPLIVWGTR